MGIEFQELFNWMRRRKIFATLLVVCTLGIGVLIGTLISGHAQATHDQSATGATLLAVPDPITMSNAFSTISKKLGPAVVNISTTQVIEKPKGGNKTPKKVRRSLSGFLRSLLRSTRQQSRRRTQPRLRRNRGQKRFHPHQRSRN